MMGSEWRTYGFEMKAELDIKNVGRVMHILGMWVARERKN